MVAAPAAESDASKRALEFVCARASDCITSRVAAVLFWILSLGHSAVYLLGPGLFKDVTDFAIWVWATGGPLALATALEVGCRVSAQAGPPWRWRSWRRMMIPLFHQLEAMVLVIMLFRLGMSIYLLKVALLGYTLPASVSNQDKATVLVLCVYRAMRTWGDCHGVSVQQTLHERRQRASMKKLWMHEFQEAWREHRARRVVRIQLALNSRWIQLLFFLASLTYCIVEFSDFVITSEVLGYMLLLALAAEFVLRAKAQGGEHFFRPLLNKLEFCVLVAGTWCLFYASWYTQYLVSSKEEATSYAMATAGLLLLHRFLRFLGIWFNISASEFDSDSIANSCTVQAFMSSLGDYLDVPPTNVKLDLPGSMIHIQKANLKPEIFAALHLPITVAGGLIEDLFVDLSSGNKETSRLAFATSRTHGRMRISVKNLLLVLRPGPGLENGGPKAHGSHWHYRNIRAAKWQVVKMICQRLTVPVAAPTDAATMMSQDSLSTLKSSSSLLEMRRSLVRGVQQKIAAMPFTQMHLRNVTVQFEDHAAMLGYGCCILGMRLDSMKLDQHQGRHCDAQLSRWSLYAEPFASTEVCGILSRWRPREVVEQMVKQSCAERIRCWAFASMEDAHHLNPLKHFRRIERFADRHNIVTVQHVTLRGAPKEAPKERAEGGLLAPLRERMARLVRKDEQPSRTTYMKDIESQIGSANSPDSWEWTMAVRPIRVAVDDTQFRCLRNLQRCVGDWWVMDHAFQWHPGLSPCDPEVKRSVRKRASVLRAWWIYAVHRALVSIGRRPNFTYLNLARRMEYRLKHRRLISQVLEQSRPLVPGSRVTLKPTEAQRDELARLQTFLPYSDILACYREELVKTAARGAGALPLAVLQKSEDNDEDEEEEGGAPESESSSAACTTNVSGMELRPDSEPSLEGRWELTWSALEIWILGTRFAASKPRPILLYGEVLEIGLEADFRREAPGALGLLPPFGLLCTLKDVVVLSPYSGRACGGMGVDVVRILQPVKMSPACLIQNFPWLGVGRLGSRFACILQATPASKELHVELHLPDVRVLVWEPLALPLGHFLEERSDLSVEEADNYITAWQASPSVRSERRRPLRVTLAVQSKPRTFVFPHQVEVQVLEGVQQSALQIHRRLGQLMPCEDAVDVRLVLNVGALRVFQVSRLIGDTLGVEEARVDPHRLQLNLGGSAASYGSASFVKKFSVMVDPGRSTLSPRPWRPGDRGHEPCFREPEDVEFEQDELELDTRDEENSWTWLAHCCSSHAVQAARPLAGLPPLRSSTSNNVDVSDVKLSKSKSSFCEVSFWAVKEREFNARFLLRVGDDWYHRVTGGHKTPH